MADLHRRSMQLPLIGITVIEIFVAAVAHGAVIETVNVGNPNNVSDPTPSTAQECCFGAVPYVYRIGTLEVTNRQYAEFLNAVDFSGSNELGLYSAFMSTARNGGISYVEDAADGIKYQLHPDRADNPVVYVDWFDALRFANWLHNGQGAAGTETGAYTLEGHSPVPSNASSIRRNPDAMWFLPSENEWYKAAYHQPAAAGGDDDDYWRYPLRTNDEPYSDEPPGNDAPRPAITANYRNYDPAANGYNDGYAVPGSTTLPPDNTLSPVGAYTQSKSYYGTFDQAGNVYEWTDTLSGKFLYVRGGNWRGDAAHLSAPFRYRAVSTSEFDDLGFRVATVPEPAVVRLLEFGILATAWLLRTQRRQSGRYHLR